MIFFQIHLETYMQALYLELQLLIYLVITLIDIGITKEVYLYQIENKL